MAKHDDLDDFKDDLDFDLDGDDFGDLFGDADIEEHDSKSDRKPSSKSKSLFKKGTIGLKTLGSGASMAVKNAISSQFPTATGVLSDIKDVPSTFRLELAELNKEVGPSINELKQFKNRLAPRIKAALGISSKDMPEDSYDEDREAAIASQISGELNNIFKAERKRGKREARQKDIDSTIESIVASKRHLGQMSTLQDIRSMSMLQQGFNKSILTPFLKKNLELKYRHLYVAQETLALQKSMASAMEAKLEEIRHNTSLPNEAKVHLGELVGDTLKRRMSTKLGDSFSEIISNITKFNIQENISPITESLGMLTMPFEMMLDQMDMEAEMAEMTGETPQSLSQMAGSGLIGLALSIFGKKKFGSKMKNFFGETMSRVTGGRVKADDTFSTIEDFASLGPGELKLFLENLQQGRISGAAKEKHQGFFEILENIAEVAVPDSKTTTINFGDKALSDKAAFDYSTKRSIVETIPGFLAKILSQVTQFNTKKPAEELAYDFDRRMFMSASSLGESALKDVYGSLDARKRVLDDTHVVLSHGKSEEEIAKLDDIADDLAEFTKSSIQGRYSPIIIHQDIREAALARDPQYNAYIADVFKNVKHPLAVLDYLNDYLFYEDGTVNYRNLGLLKKSLMTGTGYLERVNDALVEKLQSSPHAAHILPKIIDTEKWMQTGEMKIDQDKVSEILDEGWVFGEDGDIDEISYADLVSIFGKEQADKIASKRRRDKIKNVLNAKERGAASGTRDFPTAQQLFRVDTYADSGLRAAWDYMASHIDSNSKLGIGISNTKTMANKVGTTASSYIQDTYEEVSKSETVKEIKAEFNALRANSIFDIISKDETRRARGIERLKNTITDFSDKTRAQLVKDIQEIAREIGIEDDDIVTTVVNALKPEKEVFGSAGDILGRPEEQIKTTAQKASGAVAKAVGKTILIWNAAKGKYEEITNLEPPKIAFDDATSLRGLMWDGSLPDNKQTEQLISSPPVVKPKTGIADLWQKSKDIFRGDSSTELPGASIAPASGGIISKIKNKVTGITNRTKKEDKVRPPKSRKKIPGGYLAVLGNILVKGEAAKPSNKLTIARDNIRDMVSSMFDSSKNDSGKSTAQELKDNILGIFKKDSSNVGATIAEKARKVGGWFGDKTKALRKPLTDFDPSVLSGPEWTDTGTFDTSIAPEVVYNKQIQILEIIADNTHRTVEELNAVKEGMAYITSMSATGEHRSLLGKIFSGTLTAASGLYKLAFGGTKLAAKGALGALQLGGFALSLPFRGATAVLRGMFGSRKKSFTDVYIVNEEKKLELLVDQHTLKRHGVFASGVKVTSVFKITEPVFHSTTKEVLIGKHHIEAGLYDKDGNELSDKETKDGIIKKLFGAAGSLLKIPFKLTGLYFSGMKGLASLAFAGIGLLFKKRNPYIDVYLKGDNTPGKQLIYGEGIKRGEYVTLDGKVLKSAYEIESPIYARDGRNIGNCVITEEQIKTGLVDIHGKKLVSKRGKSIIGRVVGAAGKAVGYAAQGIYATGKFMLEGMFKLMGLPFKGIGALGKKLFGKKDGDLSVAATGEHLKLYVGDKLDVLIDLVRRGFKLDVEDDKTGDSRRDGSYEEWLAEQEEKKRKQAEAKAGKKDTTDKGLLASIFPGWFKDKTKDDEGDKEGWLSKLFSTDTLMTGGATAYAADKFFKGTKAGRWLANTKFGQKIGSKLGGKAAAKAATDVATDAIAAGTKPGVMSRIGSMIGKHGRKIGKFMPKKVKTAMLLGGTLLGVNALQGEGDAALLADADMSGIPGGARPGHTATDSRDSSDYDAKLLEARTIGYGFVEDYEKITDIVLGLEEHAYRSYVTGEKISDDILLSIAENYVNVDDSNQHKVLSYFREWWDGRVLPIFYTFINSLTAFGIDPARRNFFGAEVDDTTRDLIYKTFINNYNKIRKNADVITFTPSDGGYRKWLISSQHVPDQDLAASAEDIKNRKIDKAEKTMSWLDKAKVAGGALVGGGIGLKMMGKGARETLTSTIGSAVSGTKNFIKGTKMVPGVGAVLESAFIAGDMYDAYKDDDMDSMVQRGIRGLGGAIGGVLGGAAAGSVSGGFGAAAGYMAGSWAGEKAVAGVAAKLSALFSSESGPGIFGKPANEWSLFKIRSAMYGIDEPEKYEKIIEHLEKLTLISITKSNIVDITDAEAYKYIDKFGYEPKENTVDKVKHFKLWYVQRFYPVFFAFNRLISTIDIRYKDLPSITKKQVALITEELANACDGILTNFEQLKPTKESYEKWFITREKGLDELNTPLDHRELDRMRTAQDDTLTKTSSHTDASIKDREAALAMQQFKEIDEKEEKRQARRAKADAIRQRRAERKAAQMPQAEIAAAAGVTAEDYGDRTPIKVDPVQFEAGSFGWVSAKFESASSGGSAAIGYDKVGGTSYGKYQFASKPGGLAEFLVWVKSNGGEKFYNRIVAAAGPVPTQPNAQRGWGNTGSRSGKIVEAWIAGVQAGELNGLEDKYYQRKLNHLISKVDKNLDPELARLIRENPAYREMALSTIVQHGDGGGYTILKEHYRPGGNTASFIDAVYMARGGKFGSSTGAVQASAKGRMDQEHAIIRQLNAEYENQSEESTDVASATDTESTGNVFLDAANASDALNVDSSATGMKTDMSVGLTSQQFDTTSGHAGGSSSISVSGTDASPNMGAAGGTGTTSITTKVAGGSKYDGQLKDLKLADSGVDIQNLHPRLKKALAGLNAEFMEMFGHPIQINSGFRSLAKQQALYDKYGPSRAAKPRKTAPHMWHDPTTDIPAAIAVDAQSDHLHKADSAGLLAKYGLNRPLWPNGKGKVKPESWHLQLMDTSTWTTAEDLLEPSEKDEQDIDTTLASTAQEAAENYAASVSDDATQQSQITDTMETQDADIAKVDMPDMTSDEAIDKAMALVPGLSATSHPSTMDTPSSGATMVAEAGPSGSSMENIAMMQLEQLRLVVQSLTSIDGNTKNLQELDFASLEAPLQSLTERISSALMSLGVEDTGGAATTVATPNPGRRPSTSNRVNLEPTPINVSSKKLSV